VAVKLSADRKTTAVAAAEASVVAEATAVTEETVSEELDGLEAKIEKKLGKAQGEANKIRKVVDQVPGSKWDRSPPHAHSLPRVI